MKISRKAVAALLTLATLVSGLALLPWAPAGAADPPPILDTNQIQMLDEPALPAWLTFAGDRTLFTSETLEGVVADEFGHGARVDADRFSMVEAYRSPVADADHAVLGDVDGSSRASAEMDAVVVSGATVRVLGSQATGYPQRASATLPAGHGTVVGVAILPGTGSTPAIVVITTAGLYRFHMSGTAPNESLASDGSTTAAVGAGSVTVPSLPLANLLDVYQRPAWDRYGVERDNPANVVAVVGRATSGNALWGRILTWDPATGTLIGSAVTRAYDVDLGTTSPASVTGAQVRYDQDAKSPSADGGSVDLPVAILHSVAGQPSARLTVQAQGQGIDQPRIDAQVCSSTEAAPVRDLSFEVMDLEGRQDGDGGQGVYTAACSVRTRSSGAAAGTFDQVHVDVRSMYRLTPGGSNSDTETFLTSNAEDIPLQRALGAPAVQVTFPCAGWLRLQDTSPGETFGCHSGFNSKDSFSWASSVAVHVVVNDDKGELVVANRSWDAPRVCFRPSSLEPPCPPQANPARLAANHRVAQTGLSTDGRPPLLLALNPEQWKVKVQVDNTTGVLKEFDEAPTPVALLVAPPTVAGANQEVSAPEFARTHGSGTGSSISSTNSIGFTVGLDWEDPTGAFAVGAELGIEGAFSEDHEASKTVEITDFYEGRSDENTIVYRTQMARQLTGRVIESSTGVGYTGQQRSIPVMIPEGVATTARTLSSFQTAFPNAYHRFESGLTSSVPSRLGNPGLYVAPSGIDDYCIGELADDGGIDETLSTPDLPDNPFAENPTEQSGPDILVGDQRVVSAGDGGSVVTGSGFDITDEQSASRASEVTLSASVSATVGYVSLGVNFAHSWGAETTQTLSEGVSFSAGVGSIPNPELRDEGYNWKAFLCKRDIGGDTGSLPIWVLNYAVDSYVGIGGLEPLEDIELTHPVESTVATRTPDLEWSQPLGTVRSYDLELEAVGANDVHTASGLATAANLAAATDRADVVVDWQEVLDAQATGQRSTLLPNQLYRWRTTGTDYFGNEIVSPYEFFVTDGPPQGVDIDLDVPNPDVGDTINVTINHIHVTNVSPPVTYTYKCDFGDGTVTTGATEAFAHAYAFPGIYILKCTVTNNAGEATDETVVVPVGPNANDDSYAVDEDTTLTVDRQHGVLANDAGAEAAVIGTRPAHGTVDLLSDGSFTYKPAADYCGGDGFSYGARGGAAIRPAFVSIQVRCVNDPPVATDATYSGLEDQAISGGSFSLMGTVTDVDNVVPQQLTIERVPGSGPDPAKGTLTIDQFGAFTYTPEPNYCNDARGTDSFMARAHDGQAYSNAFKVTLKVECVPDPPTAVADPKITLDEDSTKTLRPTDNDTDPDTPVGNLRPHISTPSAHGGTVTVAANGTVTYKPQENYCGTDTFGYRAFDGSVESLNEVVIDVEVGCVNDAPTGGAGTASTVEDDTDGVDIRPSDVLSDVEDQVLDLEVIDGPSNGSIEVSGDGITWVYTPDADFCGTDAVTFEGSDDEGLTAEATFTITVSCVNDAPQSHGDTVVLNEDGTTTVTPLANDTDVDGPPLTVVVQDPPDHGSLTPEPNGTLTYTPASNYCGTDSFTYVASDGSLSSAPATVSITVNCVNDTPVVVADPAPIGNEDTPIPSDPTANDTDVEGDDLHPVITQQGEHGDAVVNPDDTITYSPDPNYCGTDTYKYAVTDGETRSPEVAVTVTITCVNDAPVAGNDGPSAGTNAYRTDQGGPPLVVAAPGVLSNDTDVEGDPLTASVLTGPSHGTLVLNPNGGFTYTPTAGYYGLDSFTYQVSDGHGGTDTGTVTIRVRGITKMAAEPVVLKFSPTLKVYVGSFQARLTDNTGAPVAGKTVVFLLGGGTQVACTAQTNANGVATCTATLVNLVLALLGPPQAVFAGDDTMIGSSAKSTLVRL